jgi:hypothetical protein
VNQLPGVPGLIPRIALGGDRDHVCLVAPILGGGAATHGIRPLRWTGGRPEPRMLCVKSAGKNAHSIEKHGDRAGARTRNHLIARVNYYSVSRVRINLATSHEA